MKKCVSKRILPILLILVLNIPILQYLNENSIMITEAFETGFENYGIPDNDSEGSGLGGGEEPNGGPDTPSDGGEPDGDGNAGNISDGGEPGGGGNTGSIPGGDEPDGSDSTGSIPGEDADISSGEGNYYSGNEDECFNESCDNSDCLIHNIFEPFILFTPFSTEKPILDYIIEYTGRNNILTGETFTQFHFAHNLSQVNLIANPDPIVYTIKITPEAGTNQNDIIIKNISGASGPNWNAGSWELLVTVNQNDIYGGSFTYLTHFDVEAVNGFKSQTSFKVDVDCKVNGVSSASDSFVYEIGSVVIPDTTYVASAVYKGYNISHAASNEVAIVDHKGILGSVFNVSDIILKSTVNRNFSLTEPGTIFTDNITVSDTIKLPDGLYFGTDAKIILDGKDLLILDINETVDVKIDGRTWKLTVTDREGAAGSITKITYKLELDKGAATYLNLSTADYQMALSGIKTELVPDDFYDNDGEPILKIESIATVDSNSVVSGIAQTPLSKTTFITIYSNGEPVKDIHNPYASSFILKTPIEYYDATGKKFDINGDAVGQLNGIVPYSYYGGAIVRFALSEFGNNQDEAITMTLTDSYNGGYNSNQLRIHSVHPGSIRLENGDVVAPTGTNPTYIYEHASIDGGYFTATVGITGIPGAANRVASIIYNNLPSGAKSVGNAYIDFILQDSSLLASIPVGSVAVGVSNTIGLGYTYKGHNVSSRATGQFIYGGRQDYDVGGSKAVRRKTPLNGTTNIGSGFYAGDILTYSLVIKNTGELALNNLTVTDILTNEAVVKEPDGPFTVKLYKDNITATFPNDNITATAVLPPVIKSSSGVSISKVAANPPTEPQDYQIVLNFADIVVSGTEDYINANRLVLPKGWTMVIEYDIEILKTAAETSTVRNSFTVGGPGTGHPGWTFSHEAGAKPILGKTPVVSIIKTEAFDYHATLNPQGKTFPNARTLPDFEAAGPGGNKTLEYTLTGTYTRMLGDGNVRALRMLEILPVEIWKLGSTLTVTAQILEGPALSPATADYTINANFGTPAGPGIALGIPTGHSGSASSNIYLTARRTDNAPIPEGTELVMTVKVAGIDLPDSLFTEDDPNFDGTRTGFLDIENKARFTVMENMAAYFDAVLVETGNHLTGAASELDNQKDAAGINHKLRILLSDEAFIGLTKSVNRVSENGEWCCNPPSSTCSHIPVLLTDYGYGGGANTYERVEFSFKITNHGNDVKANIYDLLPEGLQLEGNISWVATRQGIFMDGGTILRGGANGYTATPVTPAFNQRQRISFEFDLIAEEQFTFTYTARVTTKATDYAALLAQYTSFVRDNEVVVAIPNTEGFQPINDQQNFFEPGDSTIGRTNAVSVTGSDQTGKDLLYAKAPITYVEDKIRPGIEKVLNGPSGSRLLNSAEKETWTLTVHNTSRVPMDTFTVMDVLPAGLEYQANSYVVNAPRHLQLTYDFDVVPQYNTQGDTLLIWAFTYNAVGSARSGLTKADVSNFKITFDSKPSANAVPIQYTNVAYVVPVAQVFDMVARNAGSSGTVYGTETWIGMDGYSNTSHFSGFHAVRASANVSFHNSNLITSYKTVADNDEFANALQYVTLDMVGEEIKYTLNIENSATTPKFNFRIMDILPMVGDKGTYTSEYRGSMFSVVGVKNLRVEAGAVGSSIFTTVPSSQYTVYFSNSGQAARGQWDASNAVWSNPVNSEDANAFLIVFNDNYELPGKQRLRISFTSSVDDSTDDWKSGGVAWNSFAYQFKLVKTSLINIRVEPAKVGVRVKPENGPDIVAVPENTLTVTKSSSRGAGGGPFHFRLFVQSSVFNQSNDTYTITWMPYPGGGDFALGTGTPDGWSKVFNGLPNGIYKVLEYPNAAIRDGDTNGTQSGPPAGTVTLTYNNNTNSPEFTLIGTPGNNAAGLTVRNRGPNPDPAPNPAAESTPEPEPSPSPSASPDPDDDIEPEDDPGSPPVPPAPPTPTPDPSPTPAPPPPPPPNPPVVPNLTTMSFNPAESLLVLADGSFLVLTDEGIPLGRWILGDDFVWLFDEEIPLAYLPRSGDNINLLFYIMLAVLNLAGIGLIFAYPMFKSRIRGVRK